MTFPRTCDIILSGVDNLITNYPIMNNTKKERLKEIAESTYEQALNEFWGSANLHLYQNHNELTDEELKEVFSLIGEHLEHKELSLDGLYNDITI